MKMSLANDSSKKYLFKLGYISQMWQDFFLAILEELTLISVISNDKDDGCG